MRRALALAALTALAGCGAGTLRGSVRSAPTPTDPPSTVPLPAPDRVEGIVVDRGQNLEAGYQFWWVVDLASGTTIDGATRLVVDVGDDELGCGDDHRPISSFQIADGDPVSFEITATSPGTPPEVFMGRTDVSTSVAVAARQFRIACPPSVDDIDATIGAQRAKWEAAGIDSYEFAMTWSQFNDLAGDYRITVINGAPRRLVRGNGVQLDPDRLAGRLPTTIDEVFDALTDHVTADAFIGTYDPALGYPVEVHIDVISEAIDDELEIRISDLTLDPAVPADAADTAAVGQLIEATPIDWTIQPEQGSWHWLLVETSDGTVVDGSARLAVGVPPGELTCGERHRPIDTFESLQGGTVTFELAALDAPAPPIDVPMWAAGVAVTGHGLNISMCPPTVDDLRMAHAEARARWERAAIADYVPGTIDEVFELLESEITDERVRIIYNPQLGYPQQFASETLSMGIWELQPTPG